jgi:hypothetical protein
MRARVVARAVELYEDESAALGGVARAERPIGQFRVYRLHVTGVGVDTGYHDVRPDGVVGDIRVQAR